MEQELQDLSALFDIQVDGFDNSDYTETAKSVENTAVAPFDKRTEDMLSVLSPEPPSENEVILSAVSKAQEQAKTEPVQSNDVVDDEESIDDSISEEDVEGTVSHDLEAAKLAERMAEQELIADQEELDELIPDVPAEPPFDGVFVETAETTISVEPPPAVSAEEKPKRGRKPKDVKPELSKPAIELQPVATLKTEPVRTETKPVDEENPLGLSGTDLHAFKEIRVKSPQFCLYKNNSAYRDFYLYKFNVLRNLLSRFPVLNAVEFRKEIEEVKVSHYVGNDVVSLDLLRRKIDDVLVHRTRLNALLLEVLEQYYIWERMAELLRGKLYLDHDLRGAHKREGLILEHLQDIEMYVSEVKGVMEAAKHVDGMLKASTDTLSRQIACLQLKEATGFSSKSGTLTGFYAEKQNTPQRIDEMDTLNYKTPSHGSDNQLDFGVLDEDFQNLGI